MNKEITVERWNWGKENGRVVYSVFKLPDEVKAVKAVRRYKSDRKINKYYFKSHSNWLDIKCNCKKIICKVWWEDD